MDRISKSLLMKAALTLPVLAFLFHRTGRVSWSVAGTAICSFLVFAWYDRQSQLLVGNASDCTGGQISRSFHRQLPRLAQLARLSLPLGFVMMLISLQTNIPRYLVEKHFGRHELGIFAAMAYFMLAGNIIVSSLGQSASTRLAHCYAVGDRSAFHGLLSRLLLVAFLLGVAGVVAALFAGRPILTFFYRSEYGHHADVFVRLMVAAAIGYVGTLLGHGLMATRRLSAQLPLFALVALVTWLACLWLVPSQGLRGAAVALILAAMVQVAGATAILCFALSRKPFPSEIRVTS